MLTLFSQDMGVGGGYQAEGRGAFPYGGRGPVSNPYYEDMFRSRGPLGAMRPARAPGQAEGAQQPSGYGGAGNAATLGSMGSGGGGGASGGSSSGGGHPAMRGMGGPMGMGGGMPGGGMPGQAGPGGAIAEQLLRQARMQQQMAMQAMDQGAMSEPRPQEGDRGGSGGNSEWSHFWQGR